MRIASPPRLRGLPGARNGWTHQSDLALVTGVLTGNVQPRKIWSKQLEDSKIVKALAS